AAMLVAPGRLGTLQIANSVTATNAAAKQARDAGAQVVIVLVHMGALLVNNGVPSGPLADFAKGVMGVDLILGDHTDVMVNTTINGIPVIENRSKGVTYARVQLTWDPAQKKVSKVVAEILTPYKCQQPILDGGMGMPDL